MGYACPVCEDPQADAGHLANHLAFTAILGDDAHGAWLDEHAPGWGEMDETELADDVGDSVEETEFPQVFEDTVGGLSESAESPAERSGALFDDGSPGEEHGHRKGNEHGHDDRRDGPTTVGDLPDVAGVDAAGPTDEETAAILQEAREMTREMLGVDGDAETAGAAPAGGPEGDEGDGNDDGDGAVDDSDDGSEDAEAAGDADGNENE